MITFQNMITYPNPETVAEFLMACGMDRNTAASRGKEACKKNKRLANRMLSEQNHFKTYGEACKFVHNILDSCYYQGYLIDWPVLDTEVSTRIRASLDNKSDLVICLYKMQSGTIECITYIS